MIFQDLGKSRSFVSLLSINHGFETFLIAGETS